MLRESVTFMESPALTCSKSVVLPNLLSILRQRLDLDDEDYARVYSFLLFAFLKAGKTRGQFFYTLLIRVRVFVLKTAKPLMVRFDRL